MRDIWCEIYFVLFINFYLLSSYLLPPFSFLLWHFFCCLPFLSLSPSPLPPPPSPSHPLGAPPPPPPCCNTQLAEVSMREVVDGQPLQFALAVHGHNKDYRFQVSKPLSDITCIIYSTGVVPEFGRIKKIFF